MKRHFEWKLEPRDLWIGVFWDVKLRDYRVDTYEGYWVTGRWLHVYVCLIPMVVLHWWWPLGVDERDGR